MSKHWNISSISFSGQRNVDDFISRDFHRRRPSPGVVSMTCGIVCSCGGGLSCGVSGCRCGDVEVFELLDVGDDTGVLWWLRGDGEVVGEGDRLVQRLTGVFIRGVSSTLGVLMVLGVVVSVVSAGVVLVAVEVCGGRPSPSEVVFAHGAAPAG